MKIITDSGANLTPEEITEHDISFAPLIIKFPEGETTPEEIEPDDFYNQLRAMVPEIPTTSQPSSGVFAKLYQKELETEEDILSIHISSGLSGTIESARMGAQQAGQDRITIIDSLTLSGGQRFQVLAAAMANKSGWSKERIVERVQQIRDHNDVIFTLETLEYLARGGRIGRVQALAGSLLNLKPVITVDKKDGKYNNAGRERTLPRALKKITELIQNRYPERTPMWVTLLHGQLPQYAESLGEMLREKLQVGKLEVMQVTPVLGVHTGPGVVGAAITPMKYFEDLL